MAKMIWPLDDPSDRSFVEQLYQEYNRLILSVVKRYVPNRDDREDVTQSIMERLILYLQRLKQLEPKARSAYIAYTARSVALDWYRSWLRDQKRFPSIEGEEWQEYHQSLDEKTIEDHVILREHLDQLKEIWGELPEDAQLLLEGKYIWGHTDQELAEHLNCKSSSVRMKLTRARRKALQLLKDKEEV